MEIKLRGHHIDTFAEYYFEKIGNPAFCFLPDSALEGVSRFYGKEFTSGIFLTWEYLLANPETEIEIVQGLDYLCTNGCPKLTKRCKQSSDKDSDARSVRRYGLKIGQKITAQELLEKVTEFYERTGHQSPRVEYIKREYIKR